MFPRERFYGVIEFRKPALVIRDPELIKNVMVKDFQHFVDRPVLLGSSNEYINLHLLNLKGQEWKDMRVKLTPTFTSGKMKLMFALMEKCSETLKDKLEDEVKDGTNIIDAKNILARFTMDIIASCAFGIDTHSLTEKNAEFFRVLGGVAKTTIVRYIRRLCLVFFPFVIRVFRINLIRQEVRDFVTNIVRDTIEYRQKNNVKRNDFLDLLINIKNNKSNENGHANSDYKNKNEGLTIEQMAAQTFVFFLAGFETSSSLMAFCLYELSRHQDIQERLYKDIVEAVDKSEGKISYQVLMDVPFLDQVINETLRLYGTGQILTRVCTKPYAVPDSDLVVEQGLTVVIPLYSLHHDPHYYPYPYAFKPERFSAEESKKRHPFVFMPFGEGPRNCIGLTIEQMAAQTFVFFLAGFETSSSMMSFCLYELSRHQDIQERLYKDIVEAVDKNEGKISYQVLMEIPFLDQVINETLRLYGAGQILTRECTKPYALPDSDLILEKGLRVVIPLYSLHHDPHYYPDPYAFNPEKFSVEESKKRHPFVFMPFGEGPRNCIGMRFGQMQSKVGLATVLLNFKVDPPPNQEAPIEIDRRSVPTMPANPVLLKFTKRRTI